MPAAQPARKKSAAVAKSAKPDFVPVFAALRQMLKRFSGDVLGQSDKPGNYHLECRTILHRGKPLYFAGIRTGKNYVSFHLMSVYYAPALLKGMSPELKKRMQGKACFNFTKVDEKCFAELEHLVTEGVKRFKSEEFRQAIQKMQ